MLFAFAKLCCISLFLPRDPQPTQVAVPFQPLSSNKLPWAFLWLGHLPVLLTQPAFLLCLARHQDFSWCQPVQLPAPPGISEAL